MQKRTYRTGKDGHRAVVRDPLADIWSDSGRCESVPFPVHAIAHRSKYLKGYVANEFSYIDLNRSLEYILGVLENFGRYDVDAIIARGEFEQRKKQIEGEKEGLKSSNDYLEKVLIEI